MKKKDLKNQQSGSLPEEKRVAKKHLKAIKLALSLAGILAVGSLGGFLIYNQILVDMFNKVPQTKDPHTTENVIDPNGNDFEYGDDGQIVLDKMTEEEKALLSNKLNTLILNDANSRLFSETKIEKIKDILSVSLIPCNLCDENNEFDKYYLSILFNDEKNTYALNYLAGKEFESDAELSSDFLADFINYVEYNCALDSCTTMSETGAALKDLLENSTFVGDAFYGYQPTGDECYFIPIYDQNGEGKVYYALSGLFGGAIEEENPNKALLDDLSNPEPNNIFSSTPFIESKNLQKVLQIVKDNLSFQTRQNEKTGANNEMTKRNQPFERTK